MKKYSYLLMMLLAAQLVLAGEKRPKLKTKYIVVIVIDGPRYSETWGDSTHRLIPFYEKMSRNGVVFTNFQNDGFTYTSSGHTALTTGYRQELENVKGTQLPDHPSYLQYYLQKTGKDSSAAWMILSKDKLAILSNCYDSAYYNQYRPAVNCGNNGWGSGYRKDSSTYQVIIQTLDRDHPDLLFVNFREPDYSGHKCDLPGYLKGIKDTDSLAYLVYQYISSQKPYKGRTAFFITNDHGRHLDGVKEGFCEHGDSCSGCRHINLLAIGPDFRKNVIVEDKYSQVDLTATIAMMLGIEMPDCQGKNINIIFKK